MRGILLLGVLLIVLAGCGEAEDQGDNAETPQYKGAVLQTYRAAFRRCRSQSLKAAAAKLGIPRSSSLIRAVPRAYSEEAEGEAHRLAAYDGCQNGFLARRANR